MAQPKLTAKVNQVEISVEERRQTFTRAPSLQGDESIHPNQDSEVNRHSRVLPELEISDVGVGSSFDEENFKTPTNMAHQQRKTSPSKVIPQFNKHRVAPRHRSLVFDTEIRNSQNAIQKFPTQVSSVSGKAQMTEKQRKNLESIIQVAFKGNSDRFQEDTQLAQQIAIMEEVKDNVSVEEGIFIFSKNVRCGFQIPCNEQDFIEHYNSNNNSVREDQKPSIKKEQNIKGGTLEHAQKIVVYDYRSLFLFHHSTKFRRILVAITEDKKFENFILILIILNSIGLLMYDYKDRNNCHDYNIYVERSMGIFTWFFIGEAVLKIIAQGFIQHRNAYLRDSWNWLDLLVVITALVEMAFGGQNFKGLRTLRVFRPLRSINQFPAMKRLIRSLGASAGPLLQAVFFLSVVFILFSILGVKQFYGSFYQRCRLTSAPVNLGNDTWVWPYDKTIDRLCSKNSGGYQCKVGQICGTPLDMNLDLSTDRPESQKLINYGVTTFDNLFFGIITIFQMITQEGWVYLMYNLIDSGNPYIGRIFCVGIIISCSFFLLNVFLAVLAESIDEASKEDPYEIKKKDEITKSLLWARTKKNGEIYKGKIGVEEIQSPTQVRKNKMVIKNQSPALTHQIDEETKLDENNETIQSRVPFTEGKFTDIYSAANTHMNLDPDLEIVDDPYASLALEKSKAEELKKLLEDEEPSHLGDSKFLQMCYVIAKSQIFNFAFIFITLTNTVTLASYYKGMSQESTAVLDTMERIFRWLFFVEMLIKLLGLGFKKYVRDGFNILEALLVILSMVEEGFALANIELEAGAFTAFRAIRLLRIFRLARSWKTLHELVNMMEKSIKDVSTFSILLLIIMLIFLLLGSELFAHRIEFKTREQTEAVKFVNQTGDHEHSETPRTNFDTPALGFITIFLVIVGDDWNRIMYDFYRVLYTESPLEAYFATGYFMVLYIVGNIILLNLFLAILLANFDMNKEEDDDVEEDDIENQTNPCVKFWIWLRLKLAKYCPKYFVRPPVAEREETTSSDSSSSVQESESKEEQSSGSSVASQDQQYQKMFQVQGQAQGQQTEKVKKAPNSLEQQLLKIREENEKKRKIMKGSEQTEITITQNISLKMPAQMNEGGTSESSSSESQDPEPNQDKKQKQNDKKQQKRLTGKNRRSTTVLALIQIQKIKQMKKRQASAARLEKLKQAKRNSIGSIKLQESVLNKSFSQQEESQIIRGTSVYFLTEKSQLRKCLSKTEQSNWFSNAIIFSILISTLILILESPLYDPQSTFIKVMEYLNTAMTFVFIIEAIIKIIVYGFLFNGDSSYLRNLWNVMDFLIVIFSVLGLFPFYGDAEFIKIMRLLRVLRPLSMVSRNPGMKTVIQSLGHAIPEIANLLLVTIVILILFSILGTIFFQGLFYHCHMDNIPTLEHIKIQTKWECLDTGGEWINKDSNFDNVLNGLVTMFEIITTEGWIDIMWGGVDATSYDLVPLQNHHLSYSIFFIISMIIGNIFLLNLFVGVVINNFNIEKQKLYRNYLLTPLQIEYCDTMAKCYKMKPKAEYVKQGNYLKDYMYYITISPIFENTISICIVLNTIFMAISWYDEPEQIAYIMERVNFVFTIVFTFEAIIKITVQGKTYFKDGWNVFDFIIVVASCVDFTFGLYVGHENQSSTISVFRAFRVARLLRMIKRFQQLRKIFNTFVKSLAQLRNVTSLLLLLLVLYSVLGVSFFHGVMLSGSFDAHSNFQSFGDAMMTLLRMATGEAWNELMHDAGRQRSILFQCEIHQSFMDREDGIKGCGNSVAKAYFISFMLIVSIIFLNMFIAIILEGFSASQQEEMARIKDQAFEVFVDCWQTYDPEATGFISIDSLELLIADLIQEELKRRQGANHRQDIMFNLHRDAKLLLFVKMKNKINEGDDKMLKRDTPLRRAVVRYMNKFISELYIPTYQKMHYYQFHDTLATFINYVFSVQHCEQFDEREERIKRSKETGVYIQKWDKMQEKSLAFYKMKVTDQEMFLELSRPQFDEVVDRLEAKSKTKEERIQRVDLMRTLRRQAAATHCAQLDYWQNNVMDSSLLIGGRAIIKFAQEWKLRRQRRLEQVEEAVQSSECSSCQESQEKVIEEYAQSPPLHMMTTSQITPNKIAGIGDLNHGREEEKQHLEIQASSLEVTDEEEFETDKQPQSSFTYQQRDSMITVERTTIIQKETFTIPSSQLFMRMQQNGELNPLKVDRKKTSVPDIKIMGLLSEERNLKEDVITPRKASKINYKSQQSRRVTLPSLLLRQNEIKNEKMAGIYDIQHWPKNWRQIKKRSLSPKKKLPLI